MSNNDDETNQAHDHRHPCMQFLTAWRFRTRRSGIPLHRYSLPWITVCALLFNVMSGLQIQAQSLENEVAALRFEVQRLRKELDALRDEVHYHNSPSGDGQSVIYPEQARARTPSSPATSSTTVEQVQEPSVNEAVPLLVAQVAEQAQTKVESNSRLPVKIFGTLVSNTFFNTGEASWIDNPDIVLPRKSSLPPGSFSSTLRQSRIGAIVDGPLIGPMKASGFVTVDFYGGLSNFRTGQVMGIPRMLYAFMRLEGTRTAFEIGQDQMILAPRNPTSLAALYFPSLYRSGNLYLRAPQIRIERSFAAGGVGEFQATAGILAPVAGDFRFDSFVFISPNLAGERSRRPAIQARLAWRTAPSSSTAWEIAVSGHDARQQFAGRTEVSRAGSIDFDFRAGRAGLSGEWFIGQNIDALGGSLGQTAKSAGGFLEGRMKASQRLDFNVGFGLDRLFDRIASGAPLSGNSSVFGNIVYQFMPELVMSFEYRWLSTQPDAEAARRNHHFNLAFAYSF
ncbi:MAG: hypothetical protein HY644_13735 [Acidobacteria bacterium]|nr:hypothetical protein [Acidobacteriota bacterium]